MNQKAKTASSQLLRLLLKHDRKIDQLLEAMQQSLEIGQILDQFFQSATKLLRIKSTRSDR